MRLAQQWLAPALLCALGGSLAAAPLITPAELEPLIEAQAVRVIDVREAPAYALQHVPSALSAPYGLWRGPPANPGLVPSLADLTRLVQSLGLTPETPTVIVYAGVDSSDFGTAARAYWTLKSLGVKDISILDGGLAAWNQAGFAPSDTPGEVAPSTWEPTFDPRWMATRDQVRAEIGHPGTLLLDARPAPFFEGRIAVPQAHARGTLPGAVNLDNDLFFELGSSELMDRDALRSEAASLDAAPDQPITTFCNAGHWSATEWFVLSEMLGYENVRMYPGSMIDWTQASDPLPMMHEPGRWEQLRGMALGWAHRNLGTPAP